jgi:hypothetical protein
VAGEAGQEIGRRREMDPWRTGHLGTPIFLEYFKSPRKLLKIGNMVKKKSGITNIDLIS